ncbi:MAG TPA: SDR family oxidoreductase [Vicinamibacteria bacterium]|nr:SDR family oxidoreductase [Vicinamibacteria bacterium]
MARARKAEAEEPDLTPSRYIARVDPQTGREIPGPIDPDELLVHAHRDRHPAEVAAQFVASRVIGLTGQERVVRQGLRALTGLGRLVAGGVGAVTGSEDARRRAKNLLGVAERGYAFRFREHTHLSEKQVRERVEKLQREARSLLRARGRNPRLRVLVTGATGFLGKEILFQAASDRRIAEVVAVVRPETIRDPKTKEVVKVVQPAERGALLLKRLHITGARARRFRFLAGDIEKPDLGIAPTELERLRKSVTHVVHCAASVSFDDAYENSFRANVLGSLNALRFSHGLQRTPGSPFAQHVAIETSYIHGRKKRSIAQESALVFPRHFYNNFYELTKAMASIETDRFLVEKGLRVAQLLPSIVIGDSRTGNNRGDTKVVNAPINAFGRAKEAIERARGDLLGMPKARAIAAVACVFPGDRVAELNLVPVDRVAQGILAALCSPEAIGNRIHLATDNRIRSEDMVETVRQELGVGVRLADPTLYRNLTLPLVKAVLTRVGEPKLATALERLATIFGGYGEWGQPVHEVGNDVRILGLPIRRPDTRHAFRMLCRHNRFVQDYGRVRDPDEIARRERVWERALAAIEHGTGREVASLPPGEFHKRLLGEVDMKSFELKKKPRGRGGRSEA